MSENSDRSQLRKMLVEIYRDPKDIIRVAEDAGIDIARVENSGTPVQIWHSVLSEALRMGCVGTLVEIVSHEYGPYRERLSQVLKKIQNSPRYLSIPTTELGEARSEDSAQKASLTVSPQNPRQKLLADPMVLFTTLKAEDEFWLMDVFELPDRHEVIIGMYSVIIAGDSGSGKTAIFRAFTQGVEASLLQDQEERPLPICWFPLSPYPIENSSDYFNQQFQELFTACAFTILNYVAYNPDAFWHAPLWAQEVLVWFIFSGEEKEKLKLECDLLQKKVDEEGQHLLNNLAKWPLRIVLKPDAPPEFIIRELKKAIKELKLSNLCILVDGLADWHKLPNKPLYDGLASLFSILTWFEHHGCIYKVLLPTQLTSTITNLGGFSRPWVEVRELHWDHTKLEAIILKRLSLFFGRKISSLEEIYKSKILRTWLDRCGGYTPSGWLQHIGPLANYCLEHYQKSGRTRLTDEEWQNFCHLYPPQLVLEQEKRTLKVGAKSITGLTEQQFSIFSYMHDRAGSICTRDEIYSQVILKSESRQVLGTTPQIIDRAVLYWRNNIEPDSQNPLFLVTVKDKEYRFENVFKNLKS